MCVLLVIVGCSKQSDSDENSEDEFPDSVNNELKDNYTCGLSCMADYLDNTQNCDENTADCLSNCAGFDDDCISDCQSDDDSQLRMVTCNDCIAEWTCSEQLPNCQQECAEQRCLTECTVDSYYCAGYHSPHSCAQKCMTTKSFGYFSCDDEETLDEYLECLARGSETETHCLEHCSDFPLFEQYRTGNCQSDCIQNFGENVILKEQQTEICMAECQSMDDLMCLDNCRNEDDWELGFYYDCLYTCPCYTEGRVDTLCVKLQFAEKKKEKTTLWNS